MTDSLDMLPETLREAIVCHSHYMECGYATGRGLTRVRDVAQGTLSTEELKGLTGYERVGDLRRWLDSQRIPYFPGKGGAPWTTIDLVNAAKGLKRDAPPEPLGAEIL